MKNLDPSCERRRLILLHLLEDNYDGDKAKLIKATGYARARLYQMFHDGFGLKAARQLEHRLRLEPEFFERRRPNATDGQPAPPPAERGTSAMPTMRQYTKELSKLMDRVERTLGAMPEKARNEWARKLFHEGQQYLDEAIAPQNGKTGADGAATQ